jgi:endonuclease/exonuclease/phosphatase (EEP) superfamily protein YafD
LTFERSGMRPPATNGRALVAWVVGRCLDGALLVGGAVVAAVPLARVWLPADIAAQFLLQATLGLALAIPVALLLGRRRRAGVGSALLLVGATIMLVEHRPAAGGAIGSGSEVRVLAANLHRASGTLPSEELEDWFAATGADVVMLVEAAPRLLLDFASGGRHFGHVADCRFGPFCEALILSRRDLAAIAYHLEIPGRGAVLSADADVGGVPITFAVTHLVRPVLPSNPQHNMLQATSVVRGVAERPRLVLAGDFNAVPWGRSIAVLRRALGLHGNFLVGGTWPAWLPPGLRIHIDHVLVGCGLTLVDLWSVPLPKSDHRAVLGTIRVDASAPCDVSPPGAAGGR